MAGLEALFLQICNMSITGGYVILAVLLVRLLMRRAPARATCMLWVAAAFRLLCPVSFTAVFSLFRLGIFDMTTAQAVNPAFLVYVPDPIDSAVQPQLTTGLPVANRLIADQLPAAIPTASVNPLQIWLSLATLLWLTGVVVSLLLWLLAWLRFRRTCRQAVRLSPGVYACDRIPSPCVGGWLRPRILLPFGIPEPEQALILTHERCHIRSFDHLLKPLALLIRSVYWFNPLVWLACRLFWRDLEARCDEQVLRHLDERDKVYYGQTLLAWASSGGGRIGCPAFGETAVRSRIRRILRYRRPSARLTVLSILLAAVTLAACLANPGVTRTAESASWQGTYQFVRSIYANPLSSFAAVKEGMPDYEITETALLQRDQDGAVLEMTATFAEETVTAKEFNAFFLFDFGVPDLSGIRSIRQIARFDAESGQQNRLYAVDGAAWLAVFNGESIWHIYLLERSDGRPLLTEASLAASSTGPVNQTDATIDPSKPDPGHEPTIELAIGSGEHTRQAVRLTDPASLAAVRELIGQFEQNDRRVDGVDTLEIGTCMSIRDDGDDRARVYVAFLNEAIADKPQIQQGIGSGAATRSELTDEHYQMLYALWAGALDLPTTVRITSGEKSVGAMILRTGTPIGQAVLTDLADQLDYLPIAKDRQDMVPFRVYANERQQYGLYAVYDAETLAGLEIFHPSGLEPQTYVLREATPGRRYIVTLTTGYWCQGMIYGYTLIFGVLP
jgi:beta-lactamase regulating signal transducer with metallopeptidase domain